MIRLLLDKEYYTRQLNTAGFDWRLVDAYMGRLGKSSGSRSSCRQRYWQLATALTHRTASDGEAAKNGGGHGEVEDLYQVVKQSPGLESLLNRLTASGQKDVCTWQKNLSSELSRRLVTKPALFVSVGRRGKQVWGLKDLEGAKLVLGNWQASRTKKGLLHRLA
ncbi:hypothetical protein WJX72_009321 [[Myrmecia] bisecta]|uniref:Myb-like domain-containing protein n=1 Tax=[Myrmecia] bisecta TaxID=41462 RepID=A0AAW1PAG1_9CHLO